MGKMQGVISQRNKDFGVEVACGYNIRKAWVQPAFLSGFENSYLYISSDNFFKASSSLHPVRGFTFFGHCAVLSMFHTALVRLHHTMKG